MGKYNDIWVRVNEYERLEKEYKRKKREEKRIRTRKRIEDERLSV